MLCLFPCSARRRLEDGKLPLPIIIDCLSRWPLSVIQQHIQNKFNQTSLAARNQQRTPLTRCRACERIMASIYLRGRDKGKLNAQQSCCITGADEFGRSRGVKGCDYSERTKRSVAAVDENVALIKQGRADPEQAGFAEQRRKPSAKTLDMCKGKFSRQSEKRRTRTASRCRAVLKGRKISGESPTRRPGMRTRYAKSRVRPRLLTIRVTLNRSLTFRVETRPKAKPSGNESAVAT